MKQRNNIAAFLVGLFLLIFAPCAAEAATYYVATNGDDSNPGTAAAPWKTIAHAVKKMQAGDTTFVKGGTYNEKRILFSKSGTAAAPIRLLNAPGESPIVDFGVGQSNLLTVHRFEFQSEAGINKPIGWIVLEGFEIRHGYDGIKYYNLHDSVIRRNYIHHNIVQGIKGNGGLRVTIDRNRISDNGDFIGCANGRTQAGNNNTICNLLHGLYADGQYMNITNNVFDHNLCLGITQNGAVAYSPASHASPEFAGAQNWLIANNTFANHYYCPAISVWGSRTGNTKIINNIFYENGYGRPAATTNGISLFSTSPATGILINNNLGYSSKNLKFIANPYNSYKEGVHYTQSGNLTLDPNFMNPMVGGDFGLKPGSPAIDKGQTLSSVVEDHDGNARPAGAGYDIGAYEGGSIPRICSIVGTAVAVPTSVIDPATGNPPTRPGYVLLGVVPPGFTLSAGALDQSVSGGSVYRLTLAQLSGLTLTPPADFKGTVKIEAFFVPQ